MHLRDFREQTRVDVVFITPLQAALASFPTKLGQVLHLLKYTFKILQGIRELYQQHHNVVLPDEVLKAAVDYSVQYIPQRNLPDKAIDLVDVTAAHLAAQHPVTDVHAVEHEIQAEKLNKKKLLQKKITKQP